VCLQVLASKPIVGLILLDIFTKTEKNEPTTVEHKITWEEYKEKSCSSGERLETPLTDPDFCKIF
jgi:hypothetical protein